jgi:hypothetical protein
MGRHRGPPDWVGSDLVHGLPDALPALAGAHGWGARVLPPSVGT